MLGDTGGRSVVRPGTAVDANRTTAKVSDRRVLVRGRLDAPGTGGHALGSYVGIG